MQENGAGASTNIPTDDRFSHFDFLCGVQGSLGRYVSITYMRVFLVLTESHTNISQLHKVFEMWV